MTFHSAISEIPKKVPQRTTPAFSLLFLSLSKFSAKLLTTDCKSCYKITDHDPILITIKKLTKRKHRKKTSTHPFSPSSDAKNKQINFFIQPQTPLKHYHHSTC